MKRTHVDYKLVSSIGGVAGLSVSLFSFFLISQLHSVKAAATADTDGARSVHAFAAMASVLTSPRCLNCHIPGESPLQGDEGRPHNMNVKRGPDGGGTPAMRCTNCHQGENSPTPHAPPGAEGWRLPPPSMPMIWKGLSTGDLCRTLKDPTKNGGMTLPQLIEHFQTDIRVRWAWNPGPGRLPPPLSHEEFVDKVKEWIETGAACAR
jgi:hypothetical protein